jgi:hypothetical protein
LFYRAPESALGGHDDLEPHSLKNGYILQPTAPLITACIHFKSCNLTRYRMDAYYNLKHGSPNFYGKGPHSLLQAGSRAARRKVTVSGVPDYLNYCEMFIVYAQCTNVAADCRPMVQNTPQYNRHTHSGTPQIHRMISNNPRYKDILRILKPHSIHFMT